MMFYVLRFMLG